MPSFLSPEWVAELDRRLATLPGPSDPNGTLVVQYVVTNAAAGNATSGDEHAYTIRLGLEQGARPGRVETADVSFITDYETATRIAQGETSSQAAFMSGRLTVRGNVASLLPFAASFEKLDEVLATLRSATTF